MKLTCLKLHISKVKNDEISEQYFKLRQYCFKYEFSNFISETRKYRSYDVESMQHWTNESNFINEEEAVWFIYGSRAKNEKKS